jgi:DNA-binding NarL/FixJ family response regulator
MTPSPVPHLSDRENSVLRAYTSGLTLDAVARKLGIRQSTAKTYLSRVKEKYLRAGRPAYTKLDLASRVREDDLGFSPGGSHAGRCDSTTRTRSPMVSA